jgi:hypothetical protein
MSITIDVPSIPYPKVVFSVLAVLLLGFGSYYGYSFYQETNKPIMAEPSIVMSKTSYDIGDTITVKIEHNAVNYTGTLIKWAIYDGDKEKTDFSPYDDHVIFGTGNAPKNLRVVAAITYVYKGGFTEYITSTLVKIGNGPLPPPVPPVPIPPGPPVPTPVVFPEEKLGLSTFTYTSFNKNVDASVRVKLAQGFADNFTKFSGAIAAGVKKDTESVLKELNEANLKTVADNGSNRAAVLTFFSELQVQLSSVDDKIGLERLDNLKKCLDEISAGLKAVK